jgi:membrane protease YdiL (CAAX protease family)
MQTDMDSSAPASQTEASPSAEDVRVRHFAAWGLVSLLVSVLALVVSGADVGDDVSTKSLGMGISLFAIGGWIAQMLVWQDIDLSALFGPFPTRAESWGLVLLCTLALDVMDSIEVYLVLPMLEDVAPFLAESYTANAAEGGENARHYLWLTVSAVIAAPLVEEFLFRGVLFQRWAHAWKTPIGALVVSACCFAALHGHVFGAFVFAVVATLVYLHTQSLWPPLPCTPLAMPSTSQAGSPCTRHSFT